MNIKFLPKQNASALFLYNTTTDRELTSAASSILLLFFCLKYIYLQKKYHIRRLGGP